MLACGLWQSRAFCQLPALTCLGKTRFQPDLSYNLYITQGKVLGLSTLRCKPVKGSYSTSSG